MKKLLTITTFLILSVLAQAGEVPQVGRYQLAEGPSDRIGADDQKALYMIDTATGEVWVLNGTIWRRVLASPPQPTGTRAV